MCINVKRFIGQVWKETECQSFSPCGLGSATFLAHGCVHQPRSSLNPVCWGFLWRLHLLASLVTQSCLTLCDPMDCSMPGFPVHHQLPELAQTHGQRVGVMPSNHLILCCPLLLPPSVFPSIRVFSNESVLSIRGPTLLLEFQHQHQSSQ